MYDFIRELYDSGSRFEQLKEVAGYSELARAKATQKMFRDFLQTAGRPCAVLEIGPGSGFITEYLDRDLPREGWCTLDTMDFSDGFLENTKKKNYKVREYIHLDVTVFQDFFPIQEQYDLILFQEVLEHLVSPFIALNNINAMLKPNGYLYLTIPNSGHWRRIFLEIFRQQAFYRPKAFLDTHISEISTIGLAKLVNMAGFDIKNIDYYTSRYPILKPLKSTQVGFMLQKVETPAQRWSELTTRIANAWSARRAG